MGFYAVQSQDVLNQLLSNTSGYADTAAQGTEAMESAAADLAAQLNITTGRAMGLRQALAAIGNRF